MANRQERSGEWSRPVTAVHRLLLRIGVPRLMADHTAALFAANRPNRRKSHPPENP